MYKPGQLLMYKNTVYDEKDNPKFHYELGFIEKIDTDSIGYKYGVRWLIPDAWGLETSLENEENVEKFVKQLNLYMAK